MQLGQRNTNKGILETLQLKYKLCQSKMDLYSGKGPCLHYTLNMCQGACCGKEGPDEYNERAMNFITDVSYANPNFFVLGKGRKQGERTVIWVEKGSYQGFGYFEDDYAEQGYDFLKSVVKRYPDNRDLQSMLRSNLRKVPPKSIIVYQTENETTNSI
jgi:DNA polymerase-3 subunit epsilon